MSKIGIYKITNTVNNKVYVGKALDVDNRFSGHRSLLNNGKHHCKSLQADWNKFGSDAFNFEIVEECNADELSVLEKLMIEFYDAYNPEQGYNRKRGGKRGKQANKYDSSPSFCNNHFFTNDKGQREYNKICSECKQSCKQSYRVNIISCGNFA